MPEATTFEDVQRMFSLPTQEEVNYRPAGGSTDHACSNCRFFLRNWDGEPRCHLIANWPESIESNGICDRHETKTETVDLGTPIAVVIVEPPLTLEDSAEMALSVPKNIFQRVKEFASTLLPRATPEPPAFAVFKTVDGRNGWVARHTGKWIDREDEILAERAHEAYVERVQRGIVPMPELWMWHNKGTKHGQAVSVWKSGGFALAAGLIDDTAEGQRMFDYYQKNSGKIKLSHMFHYPKETKIDGVYHEYNTVEITTLPDGAEAFPYTSFEEIQTMSLPEVARNMILEAGGQAMLDRAVAADKQAETDTKALDSQGVAWKGYDKYETPEAIAKFAALETAQKTADDALMALADVPETIKALNDSVKLLNEKLETELAAKATLLDKINELESKQALLTDLKPPASQSSETLLQDREKTLLDSMIEVSKQLDAPSLVEKLMSVQPTVGL